MVGVMIGVNLDTGAQFARMFLKGRLKCAAANETAGEPLRLQAFHAFEDSIKNQEPARQ